MTRQEMLELVAALNSTQRAALRLAAQADAVPTGPMREALVERLQRIVRHLEEEQPIPAPCDFYYAVKNEDVHGWSYFCVGLGISDIKEILTALTHPAPDAAEVNVSHRGPDCACCERQPQKDCTIPGCTMKGVAWALPPAQRNEPDASQDAIELIQVPRAALEWLFGAMPDHEGLWFGESVKEATQKYGWRGRFREICAALGFPLPAGQQKEG